jgi:hypothetical protein
VNWDWFKKLIGRYKYPPIKEMDPILTSIDVSGVMLESAKNDIKAVLDKLRATGENRILAFKVDDHATQEELIDLHAFLWGQGLPYGLFFYYEKHDLKFINLTGVEG